MSQHYNNILDKIGNTPMVAVTRLSSGTDVEILAKLEGFNPGGSIKDPAGLKNDRGG